ncbi:hypothetical protein ABT354_04710 [Streptomyces sp. NPDC000594]|uniref:hypothetical protein n=1 Tax=Streptomyces sp. NPDC000594 TaxID=3154261 RepID=UPI00331AF283
MKTTTDPRRSAGRRRPVLIAVLTATAIATGGVIAADLGPNGAATPLNTAAAAAPLALKGPWRASAVPFAHGDLTAVAGLDSRRVWAIGHRLSGLSTGEPVALRWNGTSWTEESRLPAGNWPQSLAVRAEDDIWAVGAGTAHWNGTTWTNRALAADPAGRVVPDAVATAPDGAAWVVGRAGVGGVKNSGPAIQRWNGTAWERHALPATGPGELTALAVVAADDIWAVGSSYATADGTQSSLVLHWDGTSWKRVATPVAAGEHRWFGGVTVTPSGEVWAVGGAVATDGTERPYTARWNGRVWTEPSTPRVADGRLRAVVRTADGALWAGGGKASAPVLLRWDGADRRWERAAAPDLVIRSIAGVPGSRSLWTVGIATTGDMVPVAARLPR